MVWEHSDCGNILQIPEKAISQCGPAAISYFYEPHTHTQVKAFPALHIGTGPSVTALQLHPHPSAFLWPVLPQQDSVPPQMPPPPCRTLHTSSLPLLPFCPSPLNVTAKRRLTHYLSPPSLVPSFTSCFLSQIFIASHHRGIFYDARTHGKISRTFLVGIHIGLQLVILPSRTLNTHVHTGLLSLRITIIPSKKCYFSVPK